MVARDRRDVRDKRSAEIKRVDRVAEVKPIKHRQRVDYAAFVKHWTLATSPRDVAIKMDLSDSTVAGTAQRLRKAGVRLKVFDRNPINVEALNKIIDETEES